MWKYMFHYLLDAVFLAIYLCRLYSAGWRLTAQTQRIILKLNLYIPALCIIMRGLDM